MTQPLKPYPAYKDSGVPWLGAVPVHWSLVPNRALMKLKKQLVGNKSSEYTLLSLTKRGIIARDMEKLEGKFPTSFETYQIVEPGDLIFCLFDIDETPRTVGLSSMSGMITGAYTRFVCPNKLTSQFIYLLYVCLDDGKHLKPLYSGLRKVITKSTFLSSKLALPPLPEQLAIVRYLDYMDQRIQRYIRAKQKLIKLLEEQKQAIIHQAVTRGLDPNVPLKPSGVEWLGDVPARWEIRPAKYFYHEVDERSETGNEELLSVSHLTGVTPRSQKNITMFMASSYVGHKLCQSGDLVINTMWAWMGALGISRHSGIVSSSYGVYRPFHSVELLSEYANLLLRTHSYINEYICRSTGIRSSRLRLYPEQFLRIRIICPPLDEQQMILDYLSSKVSNIDQTISSTQQKITLLQEYRTRLIADVVTGKVDVRAAVAGLGDEPDAINAVDSITDEVADD